MTARRQSPRKTPSPSSVISRRRGTNATACAIKAPSGRRRVIESRKEIEEVRRRSIEDTLREVLPVVDNLERAADAMDDATDVAAVAQGVQMVLRGFEDIANRLGLRRVPAVGQQFDPTCHDAMQQQETDQHAPGTVVAEVVPGYFLGERLLRPAMVVVAKPPSGEAPAGQALSSTRKSP